MKIADIELSSRYLVNTDGTSDGTQDKDFKDNIWYKTDRFGGEGEAETLATILLERSSLEAIEYADLVIDRQKLQSRMREDTSGGMAELLLHQVEKLCM